MGEGKLGGQKKVRKKEEKKRDYSTVDVSVSYYYFFIFLVYFSDAPRYIQLSPLRK